MPRSEKLTPKQRLFVSEYVKLKNATQAAIKAGYSEKTARSQGQRLLTKVDIAAAIEQRLVKVEQKLEISTEYILGGIKDTIERCRQSMPVVNRKGEQLMTETEEGELVPAYTFNALGALKGYELLGKHKKLFTEKREVSFDLGRLSDEQLEELDNQLGPDTPNQAGNPA